ncbi:MAG TPA: hypothetical protein VF403_27875 [Kofleriaceae bacterium]
MKKWLFSAPIDLAVFGGTALVALILVALMPVHESGTGTFVVGVILVDVAHVWSTAFIVYLDPAEWRRRPGLYAGVPLACFAVGVALYACGGDGAFWTAIAYLAVFHFIRQQYGWVMMYRARNGERDRIGRIVDGATVYLATLYPLAWWHARLPRAFSWMKDGDFIAGTPSSLATVVGVAYAIAIGAYIVRAVWQVATRQSISWGKHLIVASTAACWYVGIVATNSDYAFTVTNVFTHGIPYMVLVYLYARAASREPASRGGTTARMLKTRGIVVFVATLWLVAYVEEMLWDRAIWHDHGGLFGGGLDVGAAAIVIAPLLAVPQLTHYVLDGLLWKRAKNPRLGRLL